ncbi:MAG: phosphoribosylaminoimidazolesuccinocarboxamide synthase [Euryarchaeota archaeon RBG_16_68_13]|nr:MAG: phosphoribosylaminoimidazolesuccinocarboxamide synthase [Euryarchaeota archaeon RBG_16_68_13]
MKFLRKGKVKEVYEVSDAELEFRFTDQISVFDKIIPSLVPHKGETLCRTSAHWFHVAESMGIRTHFLRVADGDRMRVRRVEVIPDYARITAASRNFLIPLEVIARYYVAGSLNDRLQKGRVRPEDAGFPKGHVPTYGEPLPEPFFEVTTKLEKVDRELTVPEALSISSLTAREFADLRELVLKIDARIGADVKSRGLIHVDGKKEFAFDEGRGLMVVDTYGTADEDRFWDLAAYGQGRHVELSKEFVRQYYRQIGYHAALYGAREKGLPEPDIPALPQGVLDQVRDLYVSMYERLTGERFR